MFGKKSSKIMVHVDIVFEKKISRLFIFRFLWIPVIIIPCAVAGVWYGILEFIHFWYMLILGQRSKDIWEHQLLVIRYYANWQGYMKYFVNGRPQVWPWAKP